MGAQHALELIDAKIESLREGPEVLISKEPAIGILTIVRNGLTRDPEWSDVVESNLRADLARAEADRDRARSLAVRLEQEVAALTVGSGRRVL